MCRNWERINNQINQFIERNKKEIVENVCRLVRIPSVAADACEGTHSSCYPYGETCAEALDFCAELAKEKGLVVDNYDYHGLEIRFQEKQQGKRLLFAAHADVVPASEGNLYPPFEGMVDQGYIIGRGVVDDKAPLIAILYALSFLKEKHLIPANDIRFFIGSHEETDMEDLKYYLQRAGQPDFGIAADDDFPITNGEKSVLKFELQAEKTDAKANETKNNGVKASETKSGNAEIGNENNGEENKENKANRILEEIKALFGGKVTGKCLESSEGKLCCDLRLPVSENLDRAEEAIRVFAGEKGFSVTVVKRDQGYWISEKEDIPSLLVNIYQDLTGLKDQPYTMTGCTYARHFRRGCGFGAGQQGEVKPFPKGHGGAHGPDEAQNIEVLLRALKLYILAALAIDEMWSKCMDN